MKKVLLPLLAVAIVGVVGCQKEGCTDETATNYDADAKKDDGTCTYPAATIEFEEPTSEEEIALANAGDVHVHIHFEFREEGHGYEVEMHPEGDETDMIIETGFVHMHGTELIFEQEGIDLSIYPAGTEFHLEASACLDHDCEEKITEDIHFKVVQ